jgi:hypothetical protein
MDVLAGEEYRDVQRGGSAAIVPHGVFARYVEQNAGAGDNEEHLEEHLNDAAEVIRHGARSMIAEGQDRSAVYGKLLPLFGENFLEWAKVIEVVSPEPSQTARVFATESEAVREQAGPRGPLPGQDVRFDGGRN